MFKQREELEGTALEEHKRELDDLISTLARRAHTMQGLLDTTSRITLKLPMSWTWVPNYQLITNAILMVRGPRDLRWRFWARYPQITTLLEMYIGDLDQELEGWYWKAFNPLYWLRLIISTIARALLTGAFAVFKVTSLTVDRVMESTLYKLVEILGAGGTAGGLVYGVYRVVKGLGVIGGQ